MDVVLKPFIRLMGKLKYAQKFMLISLLFVVPIIILTSSWFLEKQRSIQLLANEMSGIEQVQQVWPLVLEVQQHRGLANGYLNGNTASKAQLDEKRSEIMSRIEVIEDALDVHQYPDSYTRWTETASRLQELSESYSNLTVSDSFEEHSARIDELLQLIKSIADESGLTLDQSIDTYYMMDLLVNDLPSLVESTAIIRGKGNGALAQGILSADVANELRLQKEFTESSIQKVNKVINQFLRLEEGSYEEFVHQLMGIGTLAEDYLKLANQNILAADQLTMDPDEFFNQGTEAITSINELISLLASNLLVELDNNKTEIITARNFVAILLVVIFILISLLYIAFYRNVMITVSTLKARAQAMAAGDFSTPIALQTRDELREVGDAFNEMQSSISEVLLKNQDLANSALDSSSNLAVIAQQSSAAMKQVAESVQVVSDGTASQKRTLGETSTAMNEMAVGVNRIAEAASEVAFAAIRTSEQAILGDEQLTNSVEQIDSIRKTQQQSAEIVKRLEGQSVQISKIINVIMEVAAQTKLLALNANIEAARAGEHGRGFAVVAKEVGALAEQTTNSGMEISELLENILKIVHENVEAMDVMQLETHRGIQSIYQSKATIDRIINDVKLVSEQIQEVSATSEEMSAEMEEITASISEIASASDRSANEAETMAAAAQQQLASAEQIQAAAQSMKDMSTQLQSDLSKFILEQQ